MSRSPCLSENSDKQALPSNYIISQKVKKIQPKTLQQVSNERKTSNEKEKSLRSSISQVFNSFEKIITFSRESSCDRDPFFVQIQG